MTVLRQYSVLILMAALLAGTTAAAAEPGQLPVYIGAYSARGGKGIYLARLNLADGQLQLAGVAAELTNPSFLVFHPQRPLLYAVGESNQFAGGKTGALSALAIDAKTGRLRLLNQKSSAGAGPCHLAVDRTGKFLLAANYSSGSVACMALEEDGRLGARTAFFQHAGSSVNRQRQEGPHAHGVTLDAANRFAFVPDLGLDKILVYRFDAATGKMTPHCPAWAVSAPGAGPRHVAFHPNGRFAYVINELDNSVAVFRYDAAGGSLQPLQTVSTLPKDFHGVNTAAEIAVHPTGKFLYGSNRGHDSIVVFAIDAQSGKLRYVAHQSTQGKTPRNFALDPSGRYLLAANQDSDNIVVFAVDPHSGQLHASGGRVSVPSPVCIAMQRP